MNIAIYGKTFSPEHLDYFKLLVGKLEEYGCRLKVWKPFYDFISDCKALTPTMQPFSTPAEIHGNTEFLFSVGGDGTLLGSIALVRDSGIPIAGINLGKMGFLSSIPRTEIVAALTDIFQGKYRLENRSLIKLKNPEGLFGDINFGLNELSINKKDSASMVVIRVSVNGCLLHSYWADGLIVATPTGSTAYSMSCNGPIIAPDSQNFVITPIAPHNLTIRPIVIPDNSTISLRIESRDRQALVCLDSRSADIDPDTEIIVCKADFDVKLVQRINDNFFSTLRTKLNWGVDIRN
ncbi:MAG TPA: NAD kinase [Bacteroidales bacterium]|nr:NAD kinase [Bacteroidales bacterium]HPT01313.1 NAD kinase [Bacteroidales bacterium]